MNYPTCIVFSTDRLLWESQSPLLHPDLLEAFCWWAGERWKQWEQTTVVTCIFRTRVERTNLIAKLRENPATPKARVSWMHGDYRAIDARVRKRKGRAHHDEEELRTETNVLFPSGIARQPTILPLNHGTAPHAHFSVTLAKQAKHMRSLV